MNDLSLLHVHGLSVAVYPWNVNCAGTIWVCYAVHQYYMSSSGFVIALCR